MKPQPVLVVHGFLILPAQAAAAAVAVAVVEVSTAVDATVMMKVSMKEFNKGNNKKIYNQQQQKKGIFEGV